jgi:hypothetical protein
MKLQGLIAAAMFAQAVPAAPAAVQPADHAACMHDKDAKMACGKKDKDGKMMGSKDCCKKGQCARMKKDAEKKS